MSRLPIVGEDNNTWGTVLNEYLSVEHNEDGSQKLLTEDVSRTIYVSATGDDTTGDGSATLPYLTIGKALGTVRRVICTDVTVIISIGTGTFTISDSDLNILNSISGAGTLSLQGTLTLVDSGFTMGSAEALDPLTYAVSGGNTGSWSTNQYKYYFLKSGTVYYPITHNTTTTLSVTGPVTGTEIYQSQTILNLSNINGPFIYSPVKYLDFYYFNILTSSDLTIAGENNIKLYYCYIQNSIAGAFLYTQPNIVFSFYRCSFNNFSLALKGVTGNFGNLYIYTNINNFAFQVGDFKLLDHDYLVIENPNTGSGASALYMSNDGELKIVGTTTFPAKYLKFVNSNVAVRTANNFRCSVSFHPSKTIIKSVNYLYRKRVGTDDYAIGIFNLTFSNIYGTPVTRWFYDSMYEFVNYNTGRNIQISGLIYPEIEQNLSATLADNATTNVIIGNKLQNRSITIEYTITRGATYEKGRLDILNDGTNLTLQESTPLGDTGVTFAVNFNTNEIRLACTLTSTGTAGTMKYNATRVMITPLTI